MVPGSPLGAPWVPLAPRFVSGRYRYPGNIIVAPESSWELLEGRK